MKEEIVGEQFTTNNSGVCVVTNYFSWNEVHIKFLDTGFERVAINVGEIDMVWSSLC